MRLAGGGGGEGVRTECVPDKKTNHGTMPLGLAALLLLLIYFGRGDMR